MSIHSTNTTEPAVRKTIKRKKTLLGLQAGPVLREGGEAGRSRHRTKHDKHEKTVVISVFTMATGAQKWLILPRDGRQGLPGEKPVEQKQWKSLPFVPFSFQSLEIN